MASTRRHVWCLAGLALVFLISCEEKKRAAPDDSVEGFLKSLAFSQGGLEQLKSASSFSASIDVASQGIKGGKLSHRPGLVRIEYAGPTRDTIVQLASEKSCWQSIGPVVLPCLEPLRVHTARLSQLLEASWLWPLVGRKDRQLKIERVPAAGKEQVKLTIAGAGGEPIGTLVVDSESNHVVGLEMQTTLGSKTGAFVGTFGGFEKACGITMATERRYTFLGQPFATEKLSGMICEKLDDKLFVQPEQVKHALLEPKVMASNGMICTKLKGALSGVDAALATVMEQAQKKEVPVIGAGVLVHRKGPPQVTRPEQYQTDVCLPIESQTFLKLHAAKWKEGAFFLGELNDTRVLAGYGIGALEKITAELPKLLIDEAKKRNYETAFPMYQIVYTRAADFPAEKRVSEMHLPYVN